MKTVGELLRDGEPLPARYIAAYRQGLDGDYYAKCDMFVEWLAGADAELMVLGLQQICGRIVTVWGDVIYHTLQRAESISTLFGLHPGAYSTRTGVASCGDPVDDEELQKNNRS
jgi:hypothetical protein